MKKNFILFIIILIKINPSYRFFSIKIFMLDRKKSLLRARLRLTFSIFIADT